VRVGSVYAAHKRSPEVFFSQSVPLTEEPFERTHRGSDTLSPAADRPPLVLCAADVRVEEGKDPLPSVLDGSFVAQMNVEHKIHWVKP
jgi:hypothetical protein